MESQGSARHDEEAPPAVAVIVPARDAAVTIERVLVALRAQELDQPYEVIVVDDGSCDRTAEIVRRHEPFVTLVSLERGGGAGAARNRGAAQARAPVLAFTDADCFPTPHWLARGLEAIEGVDLVQGSVAPEPVAVRAPFDRSLVVDADGGFYQTANLFVRRETFDAVGGFRDWALERPGRSWAIDRRRGRTTRTPIGEDTLFAWTARRLGARSRFAPDALVHHEVVLGGVRDDLADRWHWTRDMPGLARLVPELRDSAFYGRWFFNARTARFDLAVGGLAAAVLTRRKACLLAAAPYARWLADESRGWGRRRGAELLAGTPIADAATLIGLVVGSVQWRCVVL